MDVIYHRNCLDGIYSAYLLYLLSHAIDQQGLLTLSKSIIGRQLPLQLRDNNHDITDFVPSNLIKLSGEGLKVEEKLFHQPGKVGFFSYGIFAGKFEQYYYSCKNHHKVLFIVDNNCENAIYIKKIAPKYDLVMVIDHHTTFKQTKKDINSLELKNVFYIWKQGICASSLTLKFLNDFFNFSQVALQKLYRKQITQIIQFVGKNDLKDNEDKISKTFVLGFYYFDIEMSQMNPWLFKRLGCLCLDYIMEKGKVCYTQHFLTIQKEVMKAELAQIPLEKQKCLILSPANPGLISDIGIVLAYLSRKNGNSNLAVLYMPSRDYFRVSCRSYRRYEKPLALELSVKYGGGGHVEAAGYRTTKPKFKSGIRSLGKPKFELDLSLELIEDIIFNRAPLI